MIIFGCVAYWLPHLLCVDLLTTIPFPLFHCLNISFYSTCNSSKVYEGIQIYWTNIFGYNNVVTFHHQLFLLHSGALMLILLLSQLLPLTLHRQNQIMQNIGEICCFFQWGQKVGCFIVRVWLGLLWVVCLCHFVYFIFISS